MIKLVMPFNTRGWDWIYGYDPRAIATPPQTSVRRYQQAA